MTTETEYLDELNDCVWFYENWVWKLEISDMSMTRRDELDGREVHNDWVLYQWCMV